MEYRNKKINFSLNKISIMVIMLMVVVIGGTFAWFSFSSKKSALVLTIGDINDTQIRLTPYQIKGEMTPVNTYTSGVYSEVQVTNGDKNTSFVLYYKINDLDVKLIDNGLAYTIIDTSDNSTVKTGYFSDLIDTSKELPESVVILDQGAIIGKTSNYKVYLWLDSSKGNQSAVQGSKLDIELNGSIGSVTITGTNTYGQELIANVVDTNVDVTYTYQWFVSNSNSTTGGTAISEVTANNKYTIGSGLAGKYIYVVVNATDERFGNRIYLDATDVDNNVSATVNKAQSLLTVNPTSLNVAYNKDGIVNYSFLGNGNLTCSMANSSIATCSVDSTGKKVKVTPITTTGSTTLTLSLSEGTDYKSDSKNVAVNIIYNTMTAGVVTINGTSTSNSTLSATVVTNTNPVADSYSYQWWYSDDPNATSGTNISGATSSTYKVDADLAGKYIGVTVTAKKTDYADSIFSNIMPSPVIVANQITAISSTIKVKETQDISTLISNAKGTLSYSIKSQTTTGSTLNGNILTAGVLSTSNDNDGSVVVTVTDAGGNNYSSSSVDVTVTVEKYTRTLAWNSSTPSSITYGDTSKVAKVNVSGSGGTAGSVTYSSGTTTVLTINSSTGAITPVAVGSSVVTANLARTSTVKTTKVTKTITVVKTDAVCPTIGDYSGEYDGSAHGITVTGSATGGTVQYSSDNSSWSTTKPTRKEVGSITTYVQVAGDNNHNTVSCGSKTVTISKKNINLETYNATYTGTTSYTRTFSTGVGDENLTITYTPYSKNAASYSYSTSSGTGKYTVSMSNGSGKTANYSISGANSFTISKRGLAITAYSTGWVSGATTYTRSNYSTGVNSETITLTYKPYSNTIGSYTYSASSGSGKFTLTLSDSTNYSVSSAGDFTINSTSATCPTVTSYSGTYDGSAHSVTVSGGSGGTIQYRTSSTGTWSTTLPTRTAYGTTYTYVQVLGDANHSTVDCGYKTVTVSKKSLSLDNHSVTYTGATTYTRSFSTGVGSETLTLTYSPYSSSVGSYTYSTSSGSGKYTVTMANGTGTASNYSISTGGKFTISSASATCPTVTAYSGAYDGSAHSVTVSGGSGGTIQYRTSSTGTWSTTLPTRTAYGTTYTYVQVLGDANHSTVDCGYKTVTVSKKSLSLGTHSVTYTGATTYTRSFSTGVGSETLSLTYKPYLSSVGSYTYSTTSGSGKYTVTMANGSGGSTGNYSISTGGKFTITAPTMTVTANSNGGSISSTTGWTGTGTTATKTVTYNSTYGTLPTPTRTGFSFKGWYTSSSGGTQVTSSTTVSQTSNHTIYAQWNDTSAPGKPTITKSDYNTFTYSATDNVGVTGYFVNKTGTAPTTNSAWVTTTSYNINGSGSYYVWARDAAGNISSYSTINAFIVTRSVGTGSSLTTRYDSTSSSTGYAFTDSSFVVLNGTNVWAQATANTGYNTPVLKRGTSTVTNPSYVTVTDNLTISSSATAASYTISYNANGGSGAPSSQTKYYGTDLTLHTTVPTRSGYTFLGWSTSSTATSATYQAGGTYTANAAATLYAVWKQSVVTPVNSYYCSGNDKKAGTSPYLMTYTGSCTMIDDGSGNWRVKFLSTGTLKFTSAVNIDAFLVGGGGGGGGKVQQGGGGGGGYTKTVKNYSVSKSTNYPIIIGEGGAGGETGETGETTSAFGSSALGGKGGQEHYNGGDGGSGGGSPHMDGGSDGEDGGSWNIEPFYPLGGIGQKSTTGVGTREFGESNGTLYSGGGGGGGYEGYSGGKGGAGGGGDGGYEDGVSGSGFPGESNTGGGGGGAYSAGGYPFTQGASGGSGIVVIRNTRDSSSGGTGDSGTSSATVTAITWSSWNYGNVITPANYDSSGTTSVGNNSVTFSLTDTTVDETPVVSNFITKTKYNLTNVHRISIDVSNISFSNLTSFLYGNSGGVYIALTNDSGDVTGSLSVCSFKNDEYGSGMSEISSGGTCSADVSGFTGNYYIVAGFVLNDRDSSTNPSLRGTISNLKLTSYGSPTQISWNSSNYTSYFNKFNQSISNTNVTVGNNTAQFYIQPRYANTSGCSYLFSKVKYDLTNVDMISIDFDYSKTGVSTTSFTGNVYLVLDDGSNFDAYTPTAFISYKYLGDVSSSKIVLDVSKLTGEYHIGFGGFVYPGSTTGGYLNPYFVGPLKLYG